MTDFLEVLKEDGVLVEDKDMIQEDILNSIVPVRNLGSSVENFENVSRFNMNQVIVGVKEDEFQRIYLDSSVRHLDVRTESVKIYKETDLKLIKNHTRKSIFNEKIILKVEINCKLSNSILEMLSNMYMKNKILIITVRNNNNVNFLVSYLNGNKNNKDYRIIKLTTVEEYKDKMIFMEKTISNMDIKYSDKEIKNLLIKVLASRIEDFETIKTSLEVAELNETLITLDYLEDMVGNVDFYRLEDLFDFMIRGVATKKIMKYLKYFLETKKYNPNWIANEFREYVLLINDFYMLKNNGYISHTLDSYTLENRLRGVKLYSKDKILDMSKYKQEKYLDYIDDIPYTYISHIAKLVMNYRNININSLELYALVYEIISIREQYSEKEFVNNRKLKIMKANAKYRKKKR